MSKKIVILTAMDIERDAIRRAARIRLKDSRKIGDTWVVEGTVQENEIVLAKTGMGKKRIDRLMDEIFRAYDVGFIIFAGVAGAVNKDLQVGDVVIPKCVESLIDRTRYDTAWTAFEGVQAGDLPIWIGGTQYTADRVFGFDDKEQLRDNDPTAAAVDMESSWVCELAARRNVPCLVIRGISDTWAFRFPKIFFITRKNLWSVIKYFPANPLDFFRFLALWRNCTRAAKNTAQVVKLLLNA